MVAVCASRLCALQLPNEYLHVLTLSVSTFFHAATATAFVICDFVLKPKFLLLSFTLDIADQ